MELWKTLDDGGGIMHDESKDARRFETSVWELTSLLSFRDGDRMGMEKLKMSLLASPSAFLSFLRPLSSFLYFTSRFIWVAKP